jgi:hypothetical protein
MSSQHDFTKTQQVKELISEQTSECCVLSKAKIYQLAVITGELVVTNRALSNHLVIVHVFDTSQL